MKTQLLRGRNAKMQECRSARAQKCRKMTVFCIFALLHFCFAFSILAQTEGGTFTDPRDGETYKTVIMPDGKRWMAENLRYSKGLLNYVYGYRPITGNIAAPGTNLQKTFYCPGPGPFSTSPNTTTTSQADPLLCEFEGALYPFWTAYGQNNGTSAVTTTNAGEQGVCPSGWHLPSDVEWSNLATALSNNFSSLQVLNAGRRDYTGVFADRGSKAYFWTSSGSGTAVVSRSFSGGTITRNASQSASDALSVRCVEGVCKDSFPIVFSAIPASCENIPVWNEIGILTGTKTRTYNLSIPASTGNWTYTVSVKSYTTSSAPTVSISGNGTASASVTFTITSPIVDKTFTILITATNPIYCGQLSETHVFTLKEVPVLTTIAGNEAVGAIKTMTDVRDCKVYSIIKMADGRWWMRENLNYQTGLTFYSASNQPFTSNTNGVPGIGAFWCGATSTTAPTSVLTNCNAFGALYTWECAMSKDGLGGWSEPPASQMYTGSGSGNPASVSGRGICPPGWHVPSDREWGDMLNAVETGTKNHNTVTGVIGAGNFAGTTAGTTLKSPSFTTTQAIAASGFSVLGVGFRQSAGAYYNGYKEAGYFRSSTGYSSNYAWARRFASTETGVERSLVGRSSGFPVRCVKD